MALRMDARRVKQNHRVFEAMGLMDSTNHQGRHMDANETMLVSRDLEEVRAELVLYEFDNFHLQEFVPFDQGPRGALTFVWRELTEFGVAELINMQTTDLPSVGAYVTENTAKYYDFGNAYHYTKRDLEASAFAGVPLDATLGRIAKEAHMRVRESAGLVGISQVGTKGLVNSTGVPVVASGLTGDWLDAATDSAEILADMNAFLYTVWVQTRQMHMANTMLLPTLAYQKVATTPFSTQVPDTILSVFLRNNPGVQVASWAKLDTAGASSKPRAMVYEKSPLNLVFKTQIDFEQEAPQQLNYNYHVPCRSAFGGVVFYRPLTAAYTDLLVDP